MIFFKYQHMLHSLEMKIGKDGVKATLLLSKSLYQNQLPLFMADLASRCLHMSNQKNQNMKLVHKIQQEINDMRT